MMCTCIGKHYNYQFTLLWKFKNKSTILFCTGLPCPWFGQNDGFCEDNKW